MLQLAVDEMIDITADLTDAFFFLAAEIENVKAFKQGLADIVTAAFQRQTMEDRFLLFGSDISGVGFFDFLHDVCEGFTMTHPVFDFLGQEGREAGKLGSQRLLGIDRMIGERILLVLGRREGV